MSQKFTIADVKAKAHGQWDTIFPRFAIDLPRKKRHSPCPSCGGTDRFKYDDKYGNGDWICNNCTAGSGKDGFELIKLCTNLEFSQIIKEVASLVGLDDNSQITDVDRKRWKQEAEVRKRIQQEEQERLYNSISKKAIANWSNVFLGDSCPYLERKQVTNFGCKVNQHGTLIVPVHDATGQMWNLQYIHADGAKTFLKDGRKKGCFHLIGTIDLLEPIICIAEGYATAASIHMATGLPVASVFDAHNIVPVAQALFKKDNTAKFVYCADDDSAKENTGVLCAQDALAITGGIIVVPNFKQVA